MKKIDNLLIVKLSSIGDVLMNIPIVDGIKKTNKNINLGWVVEDKAAEILKNYKKIDKLYILNKTKIDKYIKNMNFIKLYKYIKNFTDEIKKDNWSNSFDLQWVFRSSIIPWLSSIENRYGCVENGLHKIFINNNYIVNHDIMPKHVIKKNFQLAKDFGFIKEKLSPNCFIPLSNNLKKWANKEIDKFGSNFIKIGIAPFTKWKSKSWPLKKYIKLIKNLIKNDNYLIFIFGGKEDINRVERITKIKSNQILNYTGEISLNKFSALCKKMDLFISGDSFPMHVASFHDLKQIVFFGPTSFKKTGPLNKNSILIRKNYDCSPCYSKKCILEKNKYKCMKDISIKEVLDNIKKMIN